MIDHRRPSRREELVNWVRSRRLPKQYMRLAKVDDLEVAVHDMEHVLQRTQQMDPDERTATIKYYVEKWRDAMKGEPDLVRKQGVGRFHANAWLRGYQPREGGER